MPGAHIRRRGGLAYSGASAAFTPLSISGAVAWFDMLDATSFTNSSGFITSITNKVSSVAWTEATNPPAYLATGLNSLPALDFNGTAQQITSTEAAVVNALKNSLAHTIFMVVQPNNADRTEAIFSIAAAGTNTNRSKIWGKINTASGKYLLLFANDAASSVSLSSTAVPTIVPQVLEFRASTTQGWIQVNGAAEDPSAGGFACGTLSADRSALGVRPDLTPDDFFDGQLSELLIYNSELSSGNRSSVRQYLGSKWSITVTP